MTWWLKSLSPFTKKNKLFDHIYVISPGTKHHQKKTKKNLLPRWTQKIPETTQRFTWFFVCFFPSSFTRLWWLHEGIHEVVQVSGVNHLGVDFQNPLKLSRCFWCFSPVFLSGGWTNPFEKYESNWVNLPPNRGEDIKFLSCHHLVFEGEEDLEPFLGRKPGWW